jgi:hypothetical protein
MLYAFKLQFVAFLLILSPSFIRMSEDELDSAIMTSEGVSFLNSLVAGGMAGTTVDVALFPIDTIKTRLQSPQGFRGAGGFKGIYNGLGAAALGSAPGAALFFSTYEVSASLGICRTNVMFTENKNRYSRIYLFLLRVAGDETKSFKLSKASGSGE